MNTIDISKVRKFLSDINFPNYDIFPQTENFSTDVFKLVRGNSTLYLRILPLNENVEPQYFVHELLLEKGVKVPKAICCKRNMEIFDNRDVMITEELKGKSMLEMENSLKEDIKKQIFIEAGMDLARINEIEVEKYGDICDVRNGKLIGVEDSYEKYTLERVPKKLRSLVEKEIISEVLSEKLWKYISNNKDLLHIKNHPFLAHGDFHIEHIYQNEENYSGIIDFGDIRGTTKYHDLSFFYTFFRKYFDYLLEGYQKIYKLPDKYMNHIFLEALVYGIFKLDWLSDNIPESAKRSLIFNLFEKVIDYGN